MSNTIFNEDLANKKLVGTREFAAPIKQVWPAWIDSKILVQWWALKDGIIIDSQQNFPGGYWFYGETISRDTHYSMFIYKNIEPFKGYEADEYFCNEDGSEIPLPHILWRVTFTAIPSGTRVAVELTFNVDDEEKFNNYVGEFKEKFFDAVYGNLDELLVIPA